MTFYAHSKPGSGKGNWQDLGVHLHTVAMMASQLSPEAWRTHGHIAGLLHDAGKYQLAFQRYIEIDPEASNEGSDSRRVQHAIVGAAHAWSKCVDSLPLALAVQAHHGKLKTMSLLEDAVTNAGVLLLRDAVRDGCDTPRLMLRGKKGTAPAHDEISPVFHV